MSAQLVFNELEPDTAYGRLLGNYWHLTHADRAFTNAWIAGNDNLVKQLLYSWAEAIHLQLHKDSGVTHRELWYPLILKSTERGQGSLAKVRVGEGNIGVQTSSTCPANTVLTVGGFIPVAGYVSYPFPDQLGLGVSEIRPALAATTAIYRTESYEVSEGNIRFKEDANPADLPEYTSKTYIIDGEQVTETLVWCKDVYFDTGYLNTKLGVYYKGLTGPIQDVYEAKEALINYGLAYQGLAAFEQLLQTILGGGSADIRIYTNKNQASKLTPIKDYGDVATDLDTIPIKGVLNKDIIISNTYTPVVYNNGRPEFVIPGTDHDAFWSEVYSHENGLAVAEVLSSKSEVNIRDFFSEYVLTGKLIVVILDEIPELPVSASKAIAAHKPLNMHVVLMDRVKNIDNIDLQGMLSENIITNELNRGVETVAITTAESVFVRSVPTYDRHL